ncbi:hypothetical protein B9Z19DRAFT_123234 [Tuber borchii]|uniref:Uncharacterized protein n=1 Tax=Tuber borchii TaxID=42251 RepID=A0A2T6ZR29_TUBBO|nr:hypothetical protein B9Z19DRAFT_123234 [Tuber borchii]
MKLNYTPFPQFSLPVFDSLTEFLQPSTVTKKTPAPAEASVPPISESPSDTLLAVCRVSRNPLPAGVCPGLLCLNDNGVG